MIKEQIAPIQKLYDELQTVNTSSDKLRMILSAPLTVEFLKKNPQIDFFLRECDPATQFALSSVLAIGQGAVVFQEFESLENPLERLNTFVQTLQDLEKFYDCIGGVIGYHLNVLKLIAAQESKENLLNETISYYDPEGLNISLDTPEVRKMVRWGIEHLREMAEIYPLGGSGDRLHLQDEKTGELLPAAQLSFCGRSLLEGLIRDLQGREYLYYKLFGRQLNTPLAIMTSHDKHNHRRILDLCESHQWFGRPKESYKFFIQPLIPVITIDGEWAMHAPLIPVLKPGGHGVIWKVAKNEGVFDWLELSHRKKVVVRQINNPIAGVDKGLLALVGIGCHNQKDFGFASCKRLLNSAEGMDVLCERKKENGYDYCITNIEYTEFEKHGIPDVPVEPGSSFSRFPANTNILFADLQVINQTIEQQPIPGMLVNMKTKVPCYTSQGVVEKQAGRLESTMQNIADYILDHFEGKLKGDECHKLRTFLTLNERSKTISVVKQAYVPGKSIHGTPEGCFYDLIGNYRDLLANYCHMELPEENNEKKYLEEGPSFVALFHPTLGVLFPVIGQKIRGGRLAKGAEWVMEISEAEIVNLDLEGSLIIEAENIMGKQDHHSKITYDSNQSGKCTMINVIVRNQGMDSSLSQPAWKREVLRNESLYIKLHGNAEFFAENVTLEGEMQFEVPNGHRLVIYQQGEEIAWHCEKIPHATWEWSYTLDPEDRICLEKIVKDEE